MECVKCFVLIGLIMELKQVLVNFMDVVVLRRSVKNIMKGKEVRSLLKTLMIDEKYEYDISIRYLEGEKYVITGELKKDI